MNGDFRMKRVFLFLFLAAPFALGCSSSASDTASTPIGQACGDAQSAFCQKFESCAPFFVTLVYGDTATCQTRAVPGCTSFTSAPGSNVTGDQIEACANAVKNATCDQVLNGGVSALPACDLKGTLDNGKPCAQGLQCSSGFCPIGDNGCGTCAPRTKDGDACISGNCSDGQTCVTSAGAGGGGSSVCRATVADGQSCGESGAPCKSGSSCVSGLCTKNLASGAACTPGSGAQCDIDQGLVCQSGTCSAITLPKAGEACSAATGFTCSGSAKCSVSSGTVSGTCLAPAEDGAACDDVKGPGCKPGAKCVGGVCKVPDVTTCK